MSTAVLPPAATHVLAQLVEAVGAVAAVDPDALSWADQEALVRGLEDVRRRVDGLRLRSLEAYARGGGWQDSDHISAPAWVRDQLQTSRTEAGRALSLARALREWPAVAEALSAGRISARAAGVVCHALEALPEVDDETVRFVLAAAEVCDPAELARALAARVAAAAPEQAQSDADQVHQRRRLHHSISHDALGRLDGWLEPELAELFRDALDAETVADRSSDDDRTPAQRRHDAFGRLIRRAVQAPGAPKRHGSPVQLLILVDENGARTAGGHVLTRGALDRLSCSSPLARCMLAGSLPLDLGRTVRIATEAQYRALLVRDGGCVVRGCDRPAAWCTPHHVMPWQLGGATDLSNLVLLCEAHHHALHDRDRQLRLRDGRMLTATGAVSGKSPPDG